MVSFFELIPVACPCRTGLGNQPAERCGGWMTLLLGKQRTVPRPVQSRSEERPEKPLPPTLVSNTGHLSVWSRVLSFRPWTLDRLRCVFTLHLHHLLAV